MSETTLNLDLKNIIRKSRRLHLAGAVPYVIPHIRRKRGLRSDHKIFINQLFCEMFEKI
jgi:hypothetical protein